MWGGENPTDAPEPISKSWIRYVANIRKDPLKRCCADWREIMKVARAWLSGLVADLNISILFCTRLPLAQSAPVSGGDIARATWAFPIAGALVGGFGALVYWLAHTLALPPLVASALTLAATLAATGCLHEDGLADAADGFGGGATREQKLAIMRDSRIGTYGACALIMSLLLRGSALASLADPTIVALALVAAHAAGRATMPILMLLLPRARTDGLSADAGRPPLSSVVVAAILAVIALGFALGPMGAIIAVLLLATVVVVIGWLSLRQIDGQTGDVLGALEQISEIAILLTAAAV
jgi:adenosylcobinamide-GDP ribazoletransferase